MAANDSIDGAQINNSVNHSSEQLVTVCAQYDNDVQ